MNKPNFRNSFINILKKIKVILNIFVFLKINIYTTTYY